MKLSTVCASRSTSPLQFQGGEGSLCADDKVKLVTVRHIPALLETAGDERDNSTNLTIASRTGSGWSTPCKLSVKTTLHFGITGRFCVGYRCPALEKAAVYLADARQLGDYATRVPDTDELSAGDQKKWAKMIQLAGERQLMQDYLPTAGQQDADLALRSFWDADRNFTPIKLGNDLLLGKVGTAGFGSHFGWGDLFAAYELVGDQFQPVAGFQLSVIARYVDGYQISSSP